jgi:hypothetical protein
MTKNGADISILPHAMIRYLLRCSMLGGTHSHYSCQSAGTGKPDALSRASSPVRFDPGAMTMNLHEVMVTPLFALIAGVLILVIPRLLNLIVAIYLIAIGILGLAPHLLH